MKLILNKKLPSFIIIWSVIMGMILFSSPAFSRSFSNERRSSRDRYSSHERHSSHDRYSSHVTYYSHKRNRSHSVRIVRHRDLFPAIIATGIIAGITFSLLDNDPPTHRVAASNYCPNVASPAVVTSSVMVTAGLLNVRTGPALYEPSIGQIPSGTVLTVLGSTVGWYRVVTPGGLSGWVMAQFTSPTAPPGSG